MTTTEKSRAEAFAVDEFGLRTWHELQKVNRLFSIGHLVGRAEQDKIR